MYNLDDVVYYKNCIVGSQYSLCGFNYGKQICISGYRHKDFKNIKCPKCREIYKWIRQSGFTNYNNFMSEFKRYYNTEEYCENNNLYEDFKNNKIDLNTGISSYSQEMQNIVNKVYIDNNDIEFLKQSSEVKNIDIQNAIRYYWKYISVQFELLYGDKFYKQTEQIYMGINGDK